MTVDPTSTQHPPTRPPTAADHLSLAERFSSYAEYAASTVTVPQTAASSLDVARFHAFTGELTIAVDPAVRLYLDGGAVYHAEREGEPPISRMLLDTGVIDSMQLERGVVRVGDIDHLGRLFDRDPSIDRDAVMVVVENATEALVQQLADSVVASVRVNAYRHHPSGIHRWFVAPMEPTRVQRPSSGVMQVDRSVVEELPRLEAAGEMTIEWTDADTSDTSSVASGAEDRSLTRPAEAGPDIQAELDRFDADRADWAAMSGVNAPDGSDAIPSPLGDFHIVWPDGTRESPTATPFGSARAAHVDEPAIPDPPPAPRSLPAPPPAPEPPAPSPAPGLAAPTDTAPGRWGFDTEPLHIDQIPEPTATVPDDIAAAVRRALRAIEAGSSRPTNPSAVERRRVRVPMPELAAPTFAPPTVPAPSSTVSDELVTLAPAGPEPLVPDVDEPVGFAPPTMDMRAEVIQQATAATGRSSTDPSSTDPSSTDPSSTDPSSTDPVSIDPFSIDSVSAESAGTDPVGTEPSTPSGDQAGGTIGQAVPRLPSRQAEPGRSTDSAQERRGALRRLIDNLRNSD